MVPPGAAGVRRPDLKDRADRSGGIVGLDEAPALDQGVARARRDQSEQGPEGGCLPGSVRTEESDDPSLADVETESVDGQSRAVPLGQLVDLNRVRQAENPSRQPMNKAKVVSSLVVLTCLLLCGQAAAQNPLQGGYDEATRQLEEGFKIIATQRIASDTECYPNPDEIAATLRRAQGIDVTIASDLNSVQGFGLVNVVRGATDCTRLVLAIRAGAKGRVFVLDSDYGPVYVQGGQGLSEESLANNAGALRDLTSASSIFRMNQTDASARFEVFCPTGTTPLGGGMFNLTPLGADGSGIYPHSYERLGVQAGFHVTTTLVHPGSGRTATHRGALQVICGRGLVPTASPHATTFVKRHDTGTATAHCPQGTHLMSGGFQRTNFTTPGNSYNGVMYGGDYITESRAVGTDAWRVSGAAIDRDGGELTAIALCSQDASLPLKEVSASGRVGDGRSASVTTPRCPRGRALIAGGFSFGGSRNALFADGFFTRTGSWATTGYGWFGSADLTAYGYCAKVRDTVDRSAFPKPPPPPPPAEASSNSSGHAWLYILLGAVGLLIVVLFLRRRQVVRRRSR
jgi:hypothetical protein